MRTASGRLPRVAVLSLAGAGLLAVVGCGGGGDGGAGAGRDSACLPTVAATNAADLDRVLPLGELTVTSVHADSEQVRADGISALSPGEFAAAVNQGVEGTDWAAFQSDDEGFESEVYLSGPSDALAVIRARETDCAGQTKVTVNIAR